eukprot:s621_g9.t1
MTHGFGSLVLLGQTSVFSSLCKPQRCRVEYQAGLQLKRIQEGPALPCTQSSPVTGSLTQLRDAHRDVCRSSGKCSTMQGREQEELTPRTNACKGFLSYHVYAGPTQQTSGANHSVLLPPAFFAKADPVGAFFGIFRSCRTSWTS